MLYWYMPPARAKVEITFDQEEAVAKMLEYYEIVVDMFGRFDYRHYFTLDPKSKLNFILDAANYIADLSEEQRRQNRSQWERTI